MSKHRYLEIMTVLAVFLVAPGVYWFVSNEAIAHTSTRSLLATGQIAVGLLFILRYWMLYRKAGE